MIEILRFIFVSLIALPFVYMMYDVLSDVSHRVYDFYKQARPTFVRVRAERKRYN